MFMYPQLNWRKVGNNMHTQYRNVYIIKYLEAIKNVIEIVT